MKIQGKVTEAVIMTDEIEYSALGQIKTLCSQDMFKDSKIRIMPDVHSGAGCVIGFTAKTEGDIVCPNLIGVDISCSISAYKLDVDKINFEKLDKVIRENVPSGYDVRNSISRKITKDLKDRIYKVCKEIDDVDNYDRHLKSAGSLGGGNHYIEVNRDSEDSLWLCVHSGSRNFGHKIATYHQKIAKEQCDGKVVPKDLSYICGTEYDKYVEHMKVAQEFATKSHEIIVHEIVSKMKWKVMDKVFTNHNYIEFFDDYIIIRKGAIAAYKNQKVLIPLNMRDGTLLGVGKGNSEWNCSAPHGAGRLMSRRAAKDGLSLEEFEKEMKGVWSSCISEKTLDESPMAYKSMDMIIDKVKDTIDIKDRLIPIYNFKA